MNFLECLQDLKNRIEGVSVTIVCFNYVKDADYYTASTLDYETESITKYKVHVDGSVQSNKFVATDLTSLNSIEGVLETVPKEILEEAASVTYDGEELSVIDSDGCIDTYLS